MRNTWYGRLLTGTLCFLLAAGGVFMPADAIATQGDETTSSAAQAGEVFEDPSVLSETQEPAADTQALTEEEDAVIAIATATLTLKVRREANMESSGNGSIPKDSLVYILALGDEWCKVDTGRVIGYVQTRYLSNIRDKTLQQDGAQSDTPEATPSGEASGDTPEGFVPKFKASAYKAFSARKEMDERSSSLFKVSKYEEVTVGAIYGDWSYIQYKNSYGYVLNSALFKWDRIDAYAGDIPGMPKATGLAFINKSATIRSYEDNGGEVLKTINPGSAVMVSGQDEFGRHSFPYWRTTGYVDEQDVSYVIPVVPWDEAESGDMISCMTTFYAVGVHTLQYQGRNYNIYLASSYISGLVLHPDETLNIYNIMGPYRKSSGYHKAPIMSPHALWGYGGGTCQVNTTLYNALIQVPIYINWRKVHANVGIYYCPVGFDAAVGGGDITMIFTNTLPYAVRVNYFMSDGCMTVALFRV